MGLSSKIAAFTPAAVARAADALRRGELVGMPTETVYGLAGDAADDAAVAAIFAAKGRPSFNPLIVHVPSLAEAAELAAPCRFLEAAARRWWPGPLTLVLRRGASCPVSLLATAGLESVAVRVPAHPAAQALLRAFGGPVVAPSANRSGRISPTRPEHVMEELADAVALVLDGGPCAVGVESTVLDLTGEEPAILRPGAVTQAMLAEGLGVAVRLAAADEAVKAPGMLQSHYAPALPVRLNARSAAPGEALLAFGPESGGGASLNLSPSGNLEEAAANLFAMLRALDTPPYRAIAVAPVPEEGLGIAINDRLRRAAARP